MGDRGRLSLFSIVLGPSLGLPFVLFLFSVRDRSPYPTRNSLRTAQEPHRYAPHSRGHFMHGHASPPDRSLPAFHVKFELHRVRAKAELLHRGRRAVVAREAIGRAVFDV